MKHKLPTVFKSAITVFALATMLTACSNSESPVKSTSGTVSVTVGLTPNASSLGGGGSDKPVMAGAVSGIQLTSAQVVISSIRVKSVGEDTLDFNSTVPIIVNLDVNGIQQSLGNLALPAGTYNQTRFKIDQLDSLDGSVFSDNLDMQNLSIRLTGYVSGFADSTFTWTTSLDEEQVFEHLVAFTVTAGQTTGLSFHFDNSKWFVDELGALLDPRDGQNQSRIENNVKKAFDIEEAQNQ